jgi:hypothetical protein
MPFERELPAMGQEFLHAIDYPTADPSGIEAKVIASCGVR